jgi:hypothetical protein
MMNMVIAVFLAVVATVSYARTVRAARCGIISAPAVHYRLYHDWYDDSTLPSLHLGVTFVCFAKSTHIDRFVLTFAFPFYSDSHNFFLFVLLSLY